MLNVRDVDIYLGDELAVQDVTLNYSEFDLDTDKPQVVTATAFLPDAEAFTNEKELIIDFRDGRYAKAIIFSSMRLCDENQCEMRIVDAAGSLDELLLANHEVSSSSDASAVVS